MADADEVKQRIDVMLSSTFRDLVEHRKAVIAAMNGLQLTPLAQEFDAALPSDLIKASLDKVDAADVYVGLIASRYGQRPVCSDRNPDGLSLTELEYRHAGTRKIPRLMFIMADDHELTMAELKMSRDEGDEGHRLQKSFIEQVLKDGIAGEFSSAEDLKAKANTSFVSLQKRFERAASTKEKAAPPRPPSPDDTVPPAPPAFHYVRKPYVERQGFAGRASELGIIDQWAAGPESLLLFQAIGGMGKSALTWHWVKNRADKVRTDWAGQLWYSFYEAGADLKDFCVHALAYMRNQPPSRFRGRRTADLGDELRRELDAKPFLLILDGLERVLVAYNRAGKEHMSDEDAEVARDGMGLDRQPRDCYRPEDDEVLAMLAQCAKGKLLASSRLTPTALTNTAGQPIPGVKHIALEGLEPPDAEQMLRNVGIRGDEWKIRHFLDDKFACHPLSVGVVAGLVMTFQPARGDFDKWVESPKGGGDLALIDKKLRGRQNHILARAFDDLGQEEKELLGAIAMANIELTPDVLRILNPKRPIEPKRVKPPFNITDRIAISTAGPDIIRRLQKNFSPLLSMPNPERYAEAIIDVAPEKLQRFGLDANILKHVILMLLRDAAGDEGRRSIQEKIESHAFCAFEEHAKKYEEYLILHSNWQSRASFADEWLDKTLPDLEYTGLLQYDASSGSLDMHPAVRHAVLQSLNSEMRTRTGGHVSNALEAQQLSAFSSANSLEDLVAGLARMEALKAAGQISEAWRFSKSSGLGGALLRLEYGHACLEMMRGFLARDWVVRQDNCSADECGWIANFIAAALYSIGEMGLSAKLGMQAIIFFLRVNDRGIVYPLGNVAVSLRRHGRAAHADRLLKLAIRTADVVGNDDDHAWLKAIGVESNVDQGCLSDAELSLKALLEGIDMAKISKERRVHIFQCQIALAFYSQRLDEKVVETMLGEIEESGHRYEKCECLEFLGCWRQARGDHQGALHVFEELIRLANEVGSPKAMKYQVRRGSTSGASSTAAGSSTGRLPWQLRRRPARPSTSC